MTNLFMQVFTNAHRQISIKLQGLIILYASLPKRNQHIQHSAV